MSPHDRCWREILVEDKTCTPAELAASRIDFIAWLASLSGRDRRVAKLLASGAGTSEVAAKVGLSCELFAVGDRTPPPRLD